jgi:PTH1 family peptidyl-tRNA hydrolase
MQSFLIIGLGNPDEDYLHTRHNIGFDVADALAKKLDAPFQKVKLGWLAEGKCKGRRFFILKPDTYMNLSGKSVLYWMQQKNLSKQEILVVTDDLALPFGSIRIKPKGGDGGHNGLSSIIASLEHAEFARLRFGIGNDFSKGKQVDFVLGKWNEEERKTLAERIETCCEAILSFGLSGIGNTMTAFNGK